MDSFVTTSYTSTRLVCSNSTHTPDVINICVASLLAHVCTDKKTPKQEPTLYAVSTKPKHIYYNTPEYKYKLRNVARVLLQTPNTSTTRTGTHSYAHPHASMPQQHMKLEILRVQDECPLFHTSLVTLEVATVLPKLPDPPQNRRRLKLLLCSYRHLSRDRQERLRVTRHGRILMASFTTLFISCMPASVASSLAL